MKFLILIISSILASSNTNANRNLPSDGKLQNSPQKSYSDAAKNNSGQATYNNPNTQYNSTSSQDSSSQYASHMLEDRAFKHHAESHNYRQSRYSPKPSPTKRTEQDGRLRRFNNDSPRK